MGRRGARLLPEHAEGAGRRGVRRHHRLRHQRRRSLRRAFAKDGANVVYQAQIDATQPDVTPGHAAARKTAGAQAIVVWSVSVGMLSRLMNVRAALGWDVPIVGHPSLGSGEIRACWRSRATGSKVYMVGYRSCSFDADGKLPPRSQAFVDKLDRQDRPARHLALVGRLRLRRGEPDREGGGQAPAPAVRGHHRRLEQADGVSGHLRRLYLQPRAHNGYPQATW